MKLAQLVARAAARVPFLEGRASAVRRVVSVSCWPPSCVSLSLRSPPVPRLRHFLVYLIAAVASGTSSSSVPLLLVSRRHHLACRIVLLSRHHRLRRRLMRFIAIAPCTSSPSPRAPRRCRPACRIAVALRAASPSPCVPRRCRPARRVAVALRAASPSPCAPRRRLWIQIGRSLDLE